MQEVRCIQFVQKFQYYIRHNKPILVLVETEAADFSCSFL